MSRGAFNTGDTGESPLAQRDGGTHASVVAVPIGDVETLAFARQILAARRSRDELLPDIAASDYIWAMLVDLFIVEEEGGRLSLSGLYAAVPAPKATVLRAIARLERIGLLITGPDIEDRRRTLVRLSDDAHRRVHAALQRKRLLLAG